MRFDVSKLDALPGPVPSTDGERNEYVNIEVADPSSEPEVLFVNGMKNSGEDHKRSALALSLVRMCKVTGFYNKTASFWSDLSQCVGDKVQFSIFSTSPHDMIRSSHKLEPDKDRQIIRQALTRNPAQLAMFDYLWPRRGQIEIFAHSQGNLVVSNVMRALLALRGPGGLHGITVFSFGSPAMGWPSGLKRVEMAYTMDPVSWLGGIDLSFGVSKLGFPSSSINPVTHGFLEYLNDDPAFIINRFRAGGAGVTFNMDEEGLAKCLADMGSNTRRVKEVFDYLAANNWSDSDDVALAYTDIARSSKRVERAISGDRRLRELLVKLLKAGWTGRDEKAAIEYLNSL